ncbi:short-chain dehydrogenase [Gordonia sp. CNJ-863]|nr:short-chain dehydrogenase [Gordonia sp. CNJ-863]
MVGRLQKHVPKWVPSHREPGRERRRRRIRGQDVEVPSLDIRRLGEGLHELLDAHRHDLFAGTAPGSSWLVAAALARVDDLEGRLDVLVHNAGISGDWVVDGPTVSRVFDTNAVGIVRVAEAALPLLRKSDHPRVVTVSSSMGSFWAVTNPDRPESGLTAALYAASKSAASMLTLQYSKIEPGIKFNAIEPGFTDTDMTTGTVMTGGRPVEDSARTVVLLATIGADGPSGTLQDENGLLPW